MRPFESFMANYLADYAAYREQRGYAQESNLSAAVALDRYLKANDVSWEQLQPAFLLHLRATISPHPNTTNRMLSHVRSLFDFLVRRQIVAANPLNDIPPVPERYFVPFVFSPEQTDQLLKAVCAQSDATQPISCLIRRFIWP
jgi:site-specific recombinase XerD